MQELSEITVLFKKLVTVTSLPLHVSVPEMRTDWKSMRHLAWGNIKPWDNSAIKTVTTEKYILKETPHQQNPNEQNLERLDFLPVPPSPWTSTQVSKLQGKPSTFPIYFLLHRRGYYRVSPYILQNTFRASEECSFSKISLPSSSLYFL